MQSVTSHIIMLLLSSLLLSAQQDIDVKSYIDSSKDKSINLLEDETNPLDIIDFGFTEIYKSSEKYLNIRFHSEDITTIREVRLAGKEKGIFSFVTDKQIPAEIFPEERFTVRLIFTPFRISDFSDTLIIVIEADSTAEYKAVLKASSQIMVQTRCIDTSAAVGQEGYQYPIYASIDQDIEALTARATITLRFLADFYFPTGIDRGNIIFDTIYDKYRQIQFITDGITLQQGSKHICSVTGTVLLSNYDKCPFEILSCSWDRRWMTSQFSGGTIELEPGCHPPMGIISSLISRPVLFIHPNPAQEDLTATIDAYDNGNLMLEIYTLNGQLLDSFRWNLDNPENKYRSFSHSFDISDYPNGTYNAVLITPSHKTSSNFNVVK